MVDLATALRDAVKNRFCQLNSIPIRGLELVAGIAESLGVPGGLNAPGAAARFIDAPRSVFCGEPPIDPEVTAPPLFPNGQCEGTQYLVTLDYTAFDGVTRDVDNPLFGPVRFQGIIPCTDGVGTSRWCARFTGGEIPPGNPGAGSRDEWQPILLPGFQFDPQPTVAGIDVSPISGPDDCGGPGPSFPEFDQPYWTGPVTVDYDDPSGNPVTITPDITFSPIVIGPGGIAVGPFEVTFGPGSSLIGEIDLNIGQVNFNVGGQGGPGVNTDPNPLPLDEPINNEFLRVIAVDVTVTSIDSDAAPSEILQPGGNPNIFAPRLGNVAFKYAQPGGGEYWSSDVPVKLTNNRIYARVPALDVRGTPEDGVQWTLTKLVSILPDQEELPLMG